MTKQIPENLLYSKEHEWALIDGDIATIGITDHAQHQLGDVVFLELPEPKSTFEQNGIFGVVESVKAVSDLYAPLSGEVTEANQALVDSPEKINQDPYMESWMIKMRISDKAEVSSLMNHEEYARYLREEAK